MSIAVKNTTKLFVELESTEGTYVAPSGAASAVQVLESGLEIKPSKELLERSVFAGSIGMITPRTGTKSVSGTVPVECRAHSTEGHIPEFDLLMKSALGSRRQNTTTITTKTGNTSSILQIEDADISKLAVGDMILIKKSNAYHVSPITEKTTGTGTATVTILIPHPSGSIPDSVTIGKFTTYIVAESGHPTVSLTKYVDDAVETQAIGCRVNKLGLTNFSTGKIPEFQFGFDGLSFAQSLTAPSYTPSYDSALPPIVLNATAYMDTTALTINELSFSLENTVGFSTSITSANGKISSRVTKRKVTGTIDPYKPTDSISNYTKFNAGTQFALFACAKNDSSTSGEFANAVAVYMPSCLITELAEGDNQGLVNEKLTFSANRGTSGSTSEIYIAFI